MSKYKSNMRNEGEQVILIIKMASDSPNVAMFIPVGYFTVTQDLSTEDKRNLSKAKSTFPKF